MPNGLVELTSKDRKNFFREDNKEKVNARAHGFPHVVKVREGENILEQIKELQIHHFPRPRPLAYTRGDSIEGKEDIYSGRAKANVSYIPVQFYRLVK